MGKGRFFYVVFILSVFLTLSYFIDLSYAGLSVVEIPRCREKPVDCTEGGDKTCRDECGPSRWILRSTYGGPCDLYWKCQPEEILKWPQHFFPDYIRQETDYEVFNNWLMSSSEILWGSSSKLSEFELPIVCDEYFCSLVKKKRYCVNEKEHCYTGLACVNNKCVCPDSRSPLFESGFFQNCCPEGQVSFFGTGRFSESEGSKTSLCCDPKTTFDVEKFAYNLDKDRPGYGFLPYTFETKDGCCPKNTHYIGEYFDPFYGDVHQVCCEIGKAWKVGYKRRCSTGCCDPSNGDADCSSICPKKDSATYIVQSTCKPTSDAPGAKGVCVYDWEKREKVSGDSECIEEEITREKLGREVLCPPLKKAKIVCTDKSCIKKGTSCGFGKVSQDAFIEREYVKESKCNKEQNKCVGSPSDDPITPSIDESSIPFITEVCDEFEVCVEHRVKDYPFAESSSAPTENIGPLIAAKCEECPDSLSFGGPHGQPSPEKYLWDGMTLDAGEYNQEIVNKETGKIVKLPYVISHTKMVNNIEEAFSELQRVCQKCKKTIPGWKLEFASFHGHIATWDAIEKLNLAKYSDVANCVKKAIMSDCNAGLGDSKYPNGINPSYLSEALGGVQVVAGKTKTTGGIDIGNFGCQVLGNPTTHKGKSCNNCEINTIYYLTSPDALYPGNKGEAYQVSVTEGKLNRANIEIKTNADSESIFVEMKDEQMPCETFVLDEQEFNITYSTKEVFFDKLSITSSTDSLVAGDSPAKLTARKLFIDCNEYDYFYPQEKSLPSQQEFEALQRLFSKGSVSQEFYDDFKYRYDNQLECTRDEHCVGLRCTMGNLNCTYSCQEGKCIRDNELSVTSQVVTLSRLVSYISQWINGDIALAVLKDKITLWITGESESSTTGSTNPAETRPMSKPATGLIAYYTFDNDTTEKVFDISGEANDGSITTSAGSVVYVSGKLGKAVSFTGSGQISIPHNDAFNFGTGEFTMFGWAKISSASNEAPRHIFGKRDTTGSGNWVRVFTRDNGKIVFEFTNGDSLPSTFSYADDNWHFIAMSRSANGEVLFAVNNKTLTQTFNQDTTNTANFTLGKWFSEEGFIGEIDEVRVYNKALTQAEILEKYNAEK